MIAPVDKIKLRGDDPTGHGYYGAKRGNRKHRGLDLALSPGAKVNSMIHGIVTKIGYPYAGNLDFRYVEVTGDVYRVRIMYIEPKAGLRKGDRIYEGDLLGKAQDIASYWNKKMVNHVHIEVYKHGLLTDPEPLLM